MGNVVARALERTALGLFAARPYRTMHGSCRTGELGRQRVIDNVAGGILVILVAGVAIAYPQWAMRHGHGEDEDQELHT